MSTTQLLSLYLLQQQEEFQHTIQLHPVQLLSFSYYARKTSAGQERTFQGNRGLPPHKISPENNHQNVKKLSVTKILRINLLYNAQCRYTATLDTNKTELPHIFNFHSGMGSTSRLGRSIYTDIIS
jgi:hypothetical protein